MSKTFSGFNQDNNRFSANRSYPVNVKLPVGAYELDFNRMTGEIYFDQFELSHDKLVDLPTKEFHQVVHQLETFMTPETKVKFEKYGFLYKRSALLYGKWGTGKTCIVARVAEYAQKKGAVVIFNPDPKLLQLALPQLKSAQPNTPILVIFEELDKQMQQHEGTFLSLLDGEVQFDNIMYLATTNNIDAVPLRIRRPGRFSNVVEVGFPDAACREYYLNHKLGADSGDNITAWVEKTEGLSIDELKETVLSVKCLGQSLDEVVTRVRAAKGESVPSTSNKYTPMYIESSKASIPMPLAFPESDDEDYIDEIVGGG